MKKNAQLVFWTGDSFILTADEATDLAACLLSVVHSRSGGWQGRPDMFVAIEADLPYPAEKRKAVMSVIATDEALCHPSMRETSDVSA